MSDTECFELGEVLVQLIQAGRARLAERIGDRRIGDPESQARTQRGHGPSAAGRFRRWRATFYVTGVAHSIVGGSAWEAAPWRAGQVAASAALRKSDR